MKRKITELEQKLLDKGWVLVSKEYCGNHSQFTRHYQYYKIVDLPHYSYGVRVRLDKKRTSVLSCEIEEDYEFISKKELEDYSKVFEIVENELFGE